MRRSRSFYEKKPFFLPEAQNAVFLHPQAVVGLRKNFTAFFTSTIGTAPRNSLFFPLFPFFTISPFRPEKEGRGRGRAARSPPRRKICCKDFLSMLYTPEILSIFAVFLVKIAESSKKSRRSLSRFRGNDYLCSKLFGVAPFNE